MEVLMIVVIFIGFGFIWIGKNERRIADITEEDDQIIGLLTFLLREAKRAIPKTIANQELLEQIDMVIDDDEDSEDY